MQNHANAAARKAGKVIELHFPDDGIQLREIPSFSLCKQLKLYTKK